MMPDYADGMMIDLEAVDVRQVDRGVDYAGRRSFAASSPRSASRSRWRASTSKSIRAREEVTRDAGDARGLSVVAAGTRKVRSQHRDRLRCRR